MAWTMVEMDEATKERRAQATAKGWARIVEATMSLRLDAGTPEAQEWHARQRAYLRKYRAGQRQKGA